MLDPFGPMKYVSFTSFFSKSKTTIPKPHARNAYFPDIKIVLMVLFPGTFFLFISERFNT